MEFFTAYALTIAIEGAALFLVLRKRYPPPEIAKNAVIASSLTLPFVWFFFPALGLAWAPQTALAEAFAFLAEAGVYRFLFPGLGWKDALAASLACNALSLAAGHVLG